MESFLTTIARRMDDKSLPALMIGGNAITALGHPRATFDLDLLIPRSAAGSWRAELAQLSYALFSECQRISINTNRHRISRFRRSI